MSVTTLSTRGQLVIPVDVREAIGLKPGDKVTVVVDDDGAGAHLRKMETLDEIAKRLSKYVKPGIPPLVDVREIYESRAPRV